MTDQRQENPGPDVESLFVLAGGRVSRGLERVKLAQDARLRTGRILAISTLVTWLPLFVLSLIEGVAWGQTVEVPFLGDFLPYGQFLMAVPVLILAEGAVGRYLGRAAAELRRSDVLDLDDTAAFDGLLTRAVDRWRGKGLDALLLTLTLIITAVSVLGAREWLTGSWQYVDGRMTLPGWWYLLVSMPVIRFLALRWLWRLMLWAWVLWKTARMNLNLQPAHPDRAGGLAFLGGTQAVFGVLVFAFGVQLSCVVADAVHFRGADLMSFRGEVIAFVVSMVVLMLMPLLVFAPKMAKAREAHLISLSGRGYRGAAHLAQKFRESETDALPVFEVSGLSDFGILYENARHMRVLPVEMRHILALVLAAVLPFLPLVFLVMPAQKVFQTLAKLLM